MNFKNPGRWFSFHRKEQAGVFVLLGVAVVFALLPRFILSQKEPARIHFAEDSLARLSLIAQYNQTQDSLRKFRFKKRGSFLNNSEQALIKMGFSKEAARRIREQVNSKGTVNYADLTAISGMDSSALERMIVESEHRNRPRYQKFSPENPLELNGADSASLCALPGIGAKTAHRILDFRNKLGGFYRSAQILETLWVDTVALKKLLPSLSANSALIKKLDLRTASAESLAKHPYVSKKDAGLILSFYRQHQHFTKEDLIQHPGISQTAKRNLQFYL